MDKQEFYKQLVHRYLTNQATEEELETFFHLVETGEIISTLEAYLDEEAIIMAAEETETQARRSLLWPKIAIAASVLIALSIGIYTYQHKHQAPTTQIAQNDVNPGTNKAILTLANGQKIIITDAKKGAIAQQGNTQISKTADGQVVYTANAAPSPLEKAGDEAMNTIETPRAAKTTVTLSDGTKVWLDAASSIRFPAAFTGNTREVTTTGQVYFEVAHNAQKPFRVMTKEQTIEVLGTHFNINAYDDETAIKTTLLEGSVKIRENGESALLKPGQQSIIQSPDSYRDNNSIIIKEADADEATAWKNNDFAFHNEDLAGIMRQLSRWYDIDVTYKNNVGNVRFGGLVSRDRKISAVLALMERTGKIHFQINGRRVVVIAGKE